MNKPEVVLKWKLLHAFGALGSSVWKLLCGVLCILCCASAHYLFYILLAFLSLISTLRVFLISLGGVSLGGGRSPSGAIPLGGGKQC